MKKYLGVEFVRKSIRGLEFSLRIIPIITHSHTLTLILIQQLTRAGPKHSNNNTLLLQLSVLCQAYLFLITPFLTNSTLQSFKMHFTRDGLAALLTVFALAGQGLAADTTTDAVTTLKTVAGAIGSSDPAYAAIMDAIQAVASGIEQTNRPTGATNEAINRHGSSGGQGKRAPRHGRSGDGIPDIDSVSELEARAEPLIPDFELNYSQNERRDVDEDDEPALMARAPKRVSSGPSRSPTTSGGHGHDIISEIAQGIIDAGERFAKNGGNVFIDEQLNPTGQSAQQRGGSAPDPNAEMIARRDVDDKDEHEIATRSPKGGRGGGGSRGSSGSFGKGLQTGADLAMQNPDTMQAAHDFFQQGLQIFSGLLNGRSEDGIQLAARSPKGGRGGSFGSGLVQGVRTGTNIATQNADSFQQAHDLFSQGMELFSSLLNQ